jgi:hypothetical protein
LISFADSSADIAKARQLFEEAEIDENNHRWGDALAKLEQIVLTKETAGVRFHIAVCQDNLGLIRKSLESFERARDLALQTNSADVLELVRLEIERMRARVPSIRFEIPQGAGSTVVRIDNVVHEGALTGVDIRLDPGEHQVVVTTDGRVRWKRSISLREGQFESLVVLSEPQESEPHDSEGLREDAPPSVFGARRVPTAAWIAFGTGALLGVGGAVAYVTAGGIASESEDVCSRAVVCDPKRRSTVRQWDGVALGLWVASAFGFGTGVGLIVFGKEDKPAAVVGVSPSDVYVRASF